MASSMESLGTHSRVLRPLAVSEKVFIQNQCGNNPNKWDKSNVVVECKRHDQYSVKVDGSDRLTRRNHRFLRSYTPITEEVAHPMPPALSLRVQPPQSDDPTLHVEFSKSPTPLPAPAAGLSTLLPVGAPDFVPRCELEEVCSPFICVADPSPVPPTTMVVATPPVPHTVPLVLSTSASAPAPTCDLSVPVLTSLPPASVLPVTQSRRVPVLKKQYVPEDGVWKSMG
jgi:hypothetical protein